MEPQSKQPCISNGTHTPAGQQGALEPESKQPCISNGTHTPAGQQGAMEPESKQPCISNGTHTPAGQYGAMEPESKQPCISNGTHPPAGQYGAMEPESKQHCISNGAGGDEVPPTLRRRRSPVVVFRQAREQAQHFADDVATKASQFKEQFKDSSIEQVRQQAQLFAEDVAAKASQFKDSSMQQAQHFAEDVKAKASQFKDSMFSHMFGDEASASAAVARRRAMMLVDVLVERQEVLKRRWIIATAFITFCYLRYLLPVFAHWGERYFEMSMEASAFAEVVGGQYSQVSFGMLFLTTLAYLAMLFVSTRIMEGRMPVRRIIFEMLLVYNTTQMLLNSYVFVNLIRHALKQGYRYPWGNQFAYTRESHSLGYFIWLHYHCCQLELLDTLFVVLRKKFQKISRLHVWLRLLNMWAWFLACRYACGGDAYFPAATNAATRAIVYAFYSLSLLKERGVPFFRKARVTGVQIAQFSICALHSFYCLYTFWNMQIPRFLLLLYFLVMMSGLVLYTDFQFQAEGKSQAPPPTIRRVSFAFDSSGWFYAYHFGVAYWLRQHMLPEGLSPENGAEDKFPAGLTFSGSSGGALVAAVISLGMDPAEVFELVLQKQPECRCNPRRMLPAVEDVVRRVLPSNGWKSLTGRVRVLLTRVSWRYPFFTAEVVNKFGSNEDCYHALRATCHVPFIASVLPYFYDGHAYLDGMFWPQMIVPWKGSNDDFMVRVSAFSVPMSDIKPTILPPWWSIFPPNMDVLRGLFWIGYRDAARWFGRPANGSQLCGFRNKEVASNEDADVNGDGSPSSREADLIAEQKDQSETLLAARKLLVRAPAAQELPKACPATGRSPQELVQACQAAIDKDRFRVAAVLGLSCAVAGFWLLLGLL